MTTDRSNTHSFDVSLATEIGVEKAILVGYLHFWITENEKRKSAAHLRDGEYWTYSTGPDFTRKYPYLKTPSIYRWLKELEETGWIKTGRFNEKNTDQTKWYGLGEAGKKWFDAPIYQNDNSEINSQKDNAQTPIYQNDNSNYQSDNSIYQNDNSNYQNDRPIYQNDNCNIKDTVINTVINSTTTAASSARANEELIDTSADEEKEKKAPLIPPVPPAVLTPAKRVYGDGELQALCRQFFSDDRNRYPEAMYPDFLEHWTAPVRHSPNPAEIGQELWRTHKTFPLAKRLAGWREKDLTSLKNHEQQSANSTSHVNGYAGGTRSTGPKNGHSKPIKRTPIITASKLRRDS